MKFTLSWLKDHLETDASLDDISMRLTALGLEVEGVDDPGKALAGFIVAHVIEAEKHPNADRLRVCKVTTGTETIQVVCGAPNAHAGMKAVLARPGTVIPASGETLKKGAIRGVESQGMLCSSRELKLGDDHDGIIELAADAPVGAPLAEVMKSDPVIEVALTPNRVDALGVRGIARDLAASGLGKLKPLDDSPVKGTFDSPRKVAMRLAAGREQDCPQFVGRMIHGLRNGPSPAWLQDRLKAIGLRPVSVLVDITQYITIDLGRPLHVFDDAKLNGAVGPRLAAAGETLAALNGKSYTLDADMVVIADDATALGIGGIMGGEPSSVSDGTTGVYLESALFNPLNIAATGRKLQINSDARYCFERGVDPASAAAGAERATRMILKLCGGEASHLVFGGAAPSHARQIAFDPARVKRLGGVDLPSAEIKAVLERLGFAINAVSVPWQVSPPSWRADVNLWQDVVEEVMRVKGFDHIPATPLPRAGLPKPAINHRQRTLGQIKRALAARGLNETVTWSFLARGHGALFTDAAKLVPLDNPISADLDVLRPTTIANLLAAAARNAARGLDNTTLFEIGPRFDGYKPGEQALMAGGIRAGHSTDRHWSGSRRAVDALDAKADALAVLTIAGVNPASLQIGSGSQGGAPVWYHPGRAGTLKLGNQVLATFGLIHPAILAKFDINGQVSAFEVDLDRIPSAKKAKGTARPLLKASPYQPVDRDFAFVVDATVAADAIVRAARTAERDLITDVGVFDLYEGANVGVGKKSVAISVRLQSQTATLTDAEIEAIAAKIVAAVTKATGAALRS